jgi:hypothetical protein
VNRTAAGQTAVRDAFMCVPEGTDWTIRTVAPSDLFDAPGLAALLADSPGWQKQLNRPRCKPSGRPNP